MMKIERKENRRTIRGEGGIFQNRILLISGKNNVSDAPSKDREHHAPFFPFLAMIFERR